MKIIRIIRKILCCLGFHLWQYSHRPINRPNITRQCLYCHKEQTYALTNLRLDTYLGLDTLWTDCIPVNEIREIREREIREIISSHNSHNSHNSRISRISRINPYPSNPSNPYDPYEEYDKLSDTPTKEQWVKLGTIGTIGTIEGWPNTTISKEPAKIISNPIFGLQLEE
jgi:hypothetical protein